MVQTWAVVSISSHVASRTSPDRAAVSTRNSNASLSAGCADVEPRTVSMAAATSLCGNAVDKAARVGEEADDAR